MQLHSILLALVEAVCWYLFFWFGLDSIKGGRNPWCAAAVLLVFFYVAFTACPWIHESEAWRQL